MLRQALIVATDRYSDPGLRRLRSPMGDADGLARVLGDPKLGDFAVTPLLNQPSPVVRLRVQEFFRNAARDDLLLLYFSCHGIKDDSGRLFFATTDTQVHLPDATSVEASFVNEQMSRSRSSRIVLLLDCCYSGAFATGFVAKAGDSVDLKERFEGRGRVVLTASSAMEYSFEGDKVSGSGQGSIFTRELVSGLETGAADQNADGLVSVDELYEFVHERVRERTPSQTPGKWAFQVAGDLVVARSPLSARGPAVLPGELVAAAQNPLADVRLAAVSALARLMRSSSEHAVVGAARQALKKLGDDDSHAVAAAAEAALAERPRPAEHVAPPADPPAVTVDLGHTAAPFLKQPQQPRVRRPEGPHQPSSGGSLRSRRGHFIAAGSSLLVLAVVVTVIVRLAGSSVTARQSGSHSSTGSASTSTSTETSAPASAPTTVSLTHVYGQPQAAAESTLRALGFQVHAQMVCSGTVGAGLVRQVLISSGTATAQGIAGQTDPYSDVILDDAAGVSDAGKSLRPGTSLLLKVSNGMHC